MVLVNEETNVLMEQNWDPKETDKRSQLTKEQKQLHGERIFSTNGTEITGHPICKKLEIKYRQRLYTPHTVQKNPLRMSKRSQSKMQKYRTFII